LNHWIAVLATAPGRERWDLPEPVLSALMNLSDYAGEMTDTDALRVKAGLKADSILKDADLMRRIKGIRRHYPKEHWWWWPERV